MNYKISANAKYICEKCKKAYVVTDDDLDFSSESRSERQMGLETQYCAEYEQNCDKCGNEIRLEFDVWVYPEGVFNNGQVSAHGAEIVDENVGIEHLPDNDDVIELAMLVKPLFQFRFDKFSEKLVDIWVRFYKINSKLTLLCTYIFAVVLIISISVSVYYDIKIKNKSEQASINISDQVALLRETEKNLGHIEIYIGEKKAEILATQDF